MSVLLFSSLGGFQTHRLLSYVHFYTIQLLNGWLPIKSSSCPTGLSSAAWQLETYLTFVWWQWMPEAAASQLLLHSPSPSGRLWVSVCALLDLHAWGQMKVKGGLWLLHRVWLLQTLITSCMYVLYILSLFSEPWLMCLLLELRWQYVYLHREGSSGSGRPIAYSLPLLPSMGSTAVGI